MKQYLSLARAAMLLAVCALLRGCVDPQPAFALAAAGYVTVSATYTGGVDNLVASGTICFAPATSSGQAASFRAAYSGQIMTTPVCATVTNGVFTVDLPDTAISSPANVCYNVTVTDNVTGNSLLGPGYGCVQPQAQAINYWCNPATKVCNFDQYNPNLQPNVTVQTGPTGPGFTYRGAWAPNTYYSAMDVFTYSGNTYEVPEPFTSGSTFSSANVYLWAAGGGVQVNQANTWTGVQTFNDALGFTNVSTEAFTTKYVDAGDYGQVVIQPNGVDNFLGITASGTGSVSAPEIEITSPVIILNAPQVLPGVGGTLGTGVSPFAAAYVTALGAPIYPVGSAYITALTVGSCSGCGGGGGGGSGTGTVASPIAAVWVSNSGNLGVLAKYTDSSDYSALDITASGISGVVSFTGTHTGSVTQQPLFYFDASNYTWAVGGTAKLTFTGLALDPEVAGGVNLGANGAEYGYGFFQNLGTYPDPITTEFVNTLYIEGGLSAPAANPTFNSVTSSNAVNAVNGNFTNITVTGTATIPLTSPGGDGSHLYTGLASGTQTTPNVDAFGDSFMAGTGASGAGTKFIAVATAAQGWTYTDHAVGGAGIFDQTPQSYATAVNPGSYSVFYMGDNGIGSITSGWYTSYQEAYLAVLAYRAIPDTGYYTATGQTGVPSKVHADNTAYVTQGSGNAWTSNSDSNIGFGLKTTEANDTLSYTAIGSSLLLGLRQTTTSTYVVCATVNGASYGCYSSEMQYADGADNDGYAATEAGAAFVIPVGNTAREMNVVLTCQTPGATGCLVDWLAANGNAALRQGPYVWVMGPTGSASTFQNSTGINPPLNDIVRHNAELLEGMHLNVDYVDVLPYLDFNLMPQLINTSDGHPNDAGHALMAQALTDSWSSLVGPRDRSASWLAASMANQASFGVGAPTSTCGPAQSGSLYKRTDVFGEYLCNGVAWTALPGPTGGSSSTNGIAKFTAGVLGTATPGTDYLSPSSTIAAANLSGILPAANAPALTGDVTTTAGSVATTVKGVNGTLLSGLPTGLLKNTTGTGAPSIATDSDLSSTAYAVDTGAANAYVVALSPAPTLSAGLSVKVAIANSSTGASTLNVNGLGAVSVEKKTVSGLQGIAANDLIAGQVYGFDYNAACTCFQTSATAAQATGTVTHTTGNLTATELAVGNGSADLTVDPNTTVVPITSPVTGNPISEIFAQAAFTASVVALEINPEPYLAQEGGNYALASLDAHLAAGYSTQSGSAPNYTYSGVCTKTSTSCYWPYDYSFRCGQGPKNIDRPIIFHGTEHLNGTCHFNLVPSAAGLAAGSSWGTSPVTAMGVFTQGSTTVTVPAGLTAAVSNTPAGMPSTGLWAGPFYLGGSTTCGIGNIYAGTYGSGTTYGLDNVVTYSGVKYISLQAGNVGNEPDISPAYWSTNNALPAGVNLRVRYSNLLDVPVVWPPAIFTSTPTTGCNPTFASGYTPTITGATTQPTITLTVTPFAANQRFGAGNASPAGNYVKNVIPATATLGQVTGTVSGGSVASYTITTAGAGLPNGVYGIVADGSQSSLLSEPIAEITVSGGAITSVATANAGSGLTSNVTFTLTPGTFVSSMPVGVRFHGKAQGSGTGSNAHNWVCGVDRLDYLAPYQVLSEGHLTSGSYIVATAGQYMGAYNAGTTYAQYQVVTNGGATFISLQNGNVGNTPAAAQNYWSTFCASGTGQGLLLAAPGAPTGTTFSGTIASTGSNTITAAASAFLLSPSYAAMAVGEDLVQATLLTGTNAISAISCSSGTWPGTCSGTVTITYTGTAPLTTGTGTFIIANPVGATTGTDSVPQLFTLTIGQQFSAAIGAITAQAAVQAPLSNNDRENTEGLQFGLTWDHLIIEDPLFRWATGVGGVQLGGHDSTSGRGLDLRNILGIGQSEGGTPITDPFATGMDPEQALSARDSNFYDWTVSYAGDALTGQPCMEFSPGWEDYSSTQDNNNMDHYKMGHVNFCQWTAWEFGTHNIVQWNLGSSLSGNRTHDFDGIQSEQGNNGHRFMQPGTWNIQTSGAPTVRFDSSSDIHFTNAFISTPGSGAETIQQNNSGTLTYSGGILVAGGKTTTFVATASGNTLTYVSGGGTFSNSATWAGFDPTPRFMDNMDVTCTESTTGATVYYNYSAPFAAVGGNGSTLTLTGPYTGPNTGTITCTVGHGGYYYSNNSNHTATAIFDRTTSYTDNDGAGRAAMGQVNLIEQFGMLNGVGAVMNYNGTDTTYYGTAGGGTTLYSNAASSTGSSILNIAGKTTNGDWFGMSFGPQASTNVNGPTNVQSFLWGEVPGTNYNACGGFSQSAGIQCNFMMDPTGDIVEQQQVNTGSAYTFTGSTTSGQNTITGITSLSSSVQVGWPVNSVVSAGNGWPIPTDTATITAIACTTGTWPLTCGGTTGQPFTVTFSGTASAITGSSESFFIPEETVKSNAVSIQGALAVGGATTHNAGLTMVSATPPTATAPSTAPTIASESQYLDFNSATQADKDLFANSCGLGDDPFCPLTFGHSSTGTTGVSTGGISLGNYPLQGASQISGGNGGKFTGNILGPATLGAYSFSGGDVSITTSAQAWNVGDTFYGTCAAAGVASSTAYTLLAGTNSTTAVFALSGSGTGTCAGGSVGGDGSISGISITSGAVAQGEYVTGTEIATGSAKLSTYTGGTTAVMSGPATATVTGESFTVPAATLGATDNFTTPVLVDNQLQISTSSSGGTYGKGLLVTDTNTAGQSAFVFPDLATNSPGCILIGYDTATDGDYGQLCLLWSGTSGSAANLLTLGTKNSTDLTMSNSGLVAVPHALQAGTIAGTSTTLTFSAGGSSQVGTGATTPACATNVVCDEFSGTATFTTGTGTLTAGVLLTVNFGTTRTNYPSCSTRIFGPSGVVTTETAPTTNTNQLKFNGTLAASTAYTLIWSGCGGN
jgi:hypothetical protein